MSEAGERNKGDLLYAMAKAAYERDRGMSSWNTDWDVMDSEYRAPFLADMAAAVGVLIHRGLLTSQALELMKAIDDGA